MQDIAFIEICVYAVIFTAAYAGVRIFRSWSRRRRIFDVPNERSSHTEPTPRGGGLVLAVIGLTVYFGYAFFYTGRFSYRYFIGAVLVGSISWLDDLYTVSSFRRFVIHTVSAVLIGSAFLTDRGFPLQENESLIIRILIFAAIIFWIVWMTNGYNFMDGIDGLAGTQAVVAGVGWLFAGKILEAPTAGFFGAALAAAAGGFLIQNWHPAKVFMGDVGSAFFGYTFAVLPLLAIWENPGEYRKILLTGVFLLWFFLFDSAFTLARRMARGEKIWLAHREHIYQRLALGGHSHRFVTVLYSGFAISVSFAVVCGLLDENLFKYLYTLVFAESLLLVIWLRRLEKRS